MSIKKNKKKKVGGDFHKKNYQNPFYKHAKSKKRKSETKNNNGWFLLTIFILIIGALIWFLFFSSTFNIKTIEVKNLKRVNSQEITALINKQTQEKKFLSLLSQKNIFIFSEKELKDKLKHTYNFKDINIDKNLPNTLIATLTEKERNFIYKQGVNYYYANYDKSILEKINHIKDIDPNNYYIVENLTEYNIKDSNFIRVGDKELGFVKNLLNQLNRVKNELKVEKIQIPKTYNKIILKIKNGPEVYLNPENEAKTQIENLIIIKKEKLQEKFLKQAYIDLRYGNKIYYQ